MGFGRVEVPNEDRVFDDDDNFTLRCKHLADHTLYIDYQCYGLFVWQFSNISHLKNYSTGIFKIEEDTWR